MAGQPAGWYNDPYGRYQKRWWDGNGWTGRVSTNDVETADPMGNSPVIPVAIPRTAYTTPAGAKGAVRHSRRLMWISLGAAAAVLAVVLLIAFV